MQIKTSNDVKCASSLAVLREMYNNNRSIYDVISEFAKQIIINQNLKSFNITQISALLENEFAFSVPIAVIKTALKKLSFLTKSNLNYTLNDKITITESAELKNKTNNIKHALDTILDKFIEYYSKNTKEAISSSISEELKSDFCKFLLERNLAKPNYEGYISAYILSRADDANFVNSLNEIKEGLIILYGLSYTVEAGKIDTFTYPITIYLETEILFHALGLNGTFYNVLFDDFHKQIIEINKTSQIKGKGKIVQLSYFSETKTEIDNYFNQAEHLIENGLKELDRSKIAMVEIINGCESKADVIMKKSKFYDDLTNLGITPSKDDFDITKEPFCKYNLSNLEIIDEEGEGDINNKRYHISQMLSKINYFRKNVPNPRIFSDITALMLTGNRFTLNYSDKCSGANVPFATTLNYLTNRLWFSLNKGVFTEGANILSSNIIACAKVSFAQRYNESLINEYSKLKKDLDSGVMTRETADIAIAGLKNEFIKPEDINNDILEDDTCMSLFDHTAIDKAIADRDVERHNFAEEKDELQNRIDVISGAAEKLLDEKNKEIQSNFTKELDKYNKAKEKWVKKQYRCYYLKCLLVCIVYIAVGLLLTVYAALNKCYSFSSLVILFAITFPIIERYVRIFANDFIKKCFKFVFTQKERNSYKDIKNEEYEQNHDKPKLVLKTIDDYKK